MTKLWNPPADQVHNAKRYAFAGLTAELHALAPVETYQKVYELEKEIIADCKPLMLAMCQASKSLTWEERVSMTEKHITARPLLTVKKERGVKLCYTPTGAKEPKLGISNPSLGMPMQVLAWNLRRAVDGIADNMPSRMPSVMPADKWYHHCDSILYDIERLTRDWKVELCAVVETLHSYAGSELVSVDGSPYTDGLSTAEVIADIYESCQDFSPRIAEWLARMSADVPETDWGRLGIRLSLAWELPAFYEWKLVDGLKNAVKQRKAREQAKAAEQAVRPLLALLM